MSGLLSKDLAFLVLLLSTTFCGVNIYFTNDNLRFNSELLLIQKCYANYSVSLRLQLDLVQRVELLNVCNKVFFFICASVKIYNLEMANLPGTKWKPQNKIVAPRGQLLVVSLIHGQRILSI